MVVEGQTAGPENIHPGNMIRTEQVLFRNICVYVYPRGNSEKEVMSLKGSGEGTQEGLEGEREGEMMEL